MHVPTVLTELSQDSGRADTRPGHGVTRAPVLTAAQTVARLPISPLWAGCEQTELTPSMLEICVGQQTSQEH